MLPAFIQQLKILRKGNVSRTACRIHQQTALIGFLRLLMVVTAVGIATLGWGILTAVVIVILIILILIRC